MKIIFLGNRHVVKMCGWIDGWIDGWLVGKMTGWIDGRVDRWICWADGSPIIPSPKISGYVTGAIGSLRWQLTVLTSPRHPLSIGQSLWSGRLYQWVDGLNIKALCRP